MAEPLILNADQSALVKLFDAIQMDQGRFTDARFSRPSQSDTFDAFLAERIAKRSLAFFLTGGAHTPRALFRKRSLVQARFTDDASRDVFIFSPAAATLINNIKCESAQLIRPESGEVNVRPSKQQKWAKRLVSLPAQTPADHLLYAHLGLYCQRSPSLRAVSVECARHSALAHLALCSRLTLAAERPSLTNALITLLDAVPLALAPFLDVTPLLNAGSGGAFQSFAKQSAKAHRELLAFLANARRRDVLAPLFCAHTDFLSALRKTDNIRYALATRTATSKVEETHPLLAALRGVLKVSEELVALKHRAQMLRYGDDDYDELQYCRTVLDAHLHFEKRDVDAVVESLGATLS